MLICTHEKKGIKFSEKNTVVAVISCADDSLRWEIFNFLLSLHAVVRIKNDRKEDEEEMLRKEGVHNLHGNIPDVLAFQLTTLHL